MSDEANNRHGWHIDKRLSLGHMLTTITVSVGVIMFAFDMDKRIDENAAEIRHAKEIIQMEQKNMRQNMEDIKYAIESVEKKLDRLLSTQFGHSSN